jgi:His/Glu/Gln/Arg/opine family amino acid ABC transporter permease subunit
VVVLILIDTRLIARVIPMFLGGLVETIKISVLGGIISLIIGTILGILLTTNSKIAKIIIGIYTGFIRSTPLLVQLYFIHFGLPIIGIKLQSFQSAVIALSINCAAYITEIVRGGLNSVDKGQHEAAKALGLSWFQTMKIIVLPQAFQVALPPLISQFSYLIKDTSLAAVVIVPEITYISRKVASQTYRPIESFGIPTLIYLMIFVLLRLLSNFVSTKGQKMVRG